MSEHGLGGIDLSFPTEFALPIFVGKDYVNHWAEGITNEAYHADKTAVSSTGVRHALRSPAAFFANFTKAEPKEETEAMRFGSLAHYAVCEPRKFKEKIVVMPEFTGYTKDGKLSKQSKEAKEKKAAWLAELPPDIILCDEEDQEKILGIVNAILEFEEAKNAFTYGIPEVSGYYRDPETDLLLKIRPDFLRRDIGSLTDLKTTMDCDPVKFGKQFEQKRYDVQLAMYAEGVYQITGERIRLPNIVAAEKEAPYELNVFAIDDSVMEEATKDYRIGLERIANGVKTGVWPKKHKKVHTLCYSDYFLREKGLL